MLRLIDTHCHLAAPEFDADREEVLARSKAAGVEKIIIVGTDLASSNRSLALASKDASCSATAGVHPHDASKYADAASWGEIEKLFEISSFCGVGETGLDYFYNHSPKETQVDLLERHFAIALAKKLPLVLHCRDAYEDLLEVAKRCGRGEARGVIHCFTGSAAQARLFLDQGFFISFSGIVTFANANSLREASKIVPPERLLVETDAPFLAPLPHRGKRNEPAFVLDTLKRVAEVRGEDFEKLAEITSRNAEGVFGL